MTQEKRILFEFEQYGGDFPPNELLKFQSWLDNKIDKIPEEYRAKTEIEFGTTTSYDSSYATIEISYWRPMTDVEITEKEVQKKATLAAQLANAERQLEELKRRAAA